MLTIAGVVNILWLIPAASAFHSRSLQVNNNNFFADYKFCDLSRILCTFEVATGKFVDGNVFRSVKTS